MNHIQKQKKKKWDISIKMNKVAVVYSSYYTDVIQGLLEGIKNTIDESFNVDYFKVPGSWDIIYKTNTLSKDLAGIFFNFFLSIKLIGVFDV